MNLNEFSQNLISQSNEKNEFFEFSKGSSKESFRKMSPINQVRGFKSFLERYQNPEIAQSMLSSTFWEILIETPFFKDILNSIFPIRPSREEVKFILTMQPDNYGQFRFDLLLLSPKITNKSSTALSLRDGVSGMLGIGRSAEINLIPSLFAKRRAAFAELGKGNSAITLGQRANAENSLALTDPEIFLELLLEHDFRIILAPQPKTIYTGGFLSPACGIALSANDNPISSAGILIQNKKGRLGVTGAFHGMHEDPNELYRLYGQQGSSILIGKKVFVNGLPGTIADVDLITDSCFIDLDDQSQLPVSIPFAGPMQTKPPYRTEPVRFEGLTSKMVQTNITEIGVGVPGNSPGKQRCVYTKPVTNRGDSGAALLNGNNEVVGFSFIRTGYDEVIEYSEWIWADSVFVALNL